MNIADWEAEHVRRFGDRETLVVGDKAWSSGELLEQGRRLARGLVERGIRPGDRVAIAVPNGRELFVSASATWIAGAVVVLLPHGGKDDLKRALAHCEASAVITTQEVAQSGLASAVDVRICAANEPATREGWLVLDDLVASHAPWEEPVARAARDVAQLCYTSGATGAPKAVVFTHGGIDAFLRSRARQDDANVARVVLVSVPSTAFAGRLIGLRFVGDTRYAVERFDPSSIQAAIARHRPTDMPLLPTMAEQLVATDERCRFDCSSLRRINIGGAHVPAVLIERLKKFFADDARGRERGMTPLRVVVHYGSTEAGGGFTSTFTGGDGSVGRVVPDADVRIVDAAGKQLPTGEVGEVIVRSPYCGVAYWRDPEKTATVFRNGYVHTGDLGKLDGRGELRLVGRCSEIVIQGGYNIFPQEVADVVRSMAHVKESTAVGMPNELLGEELVLCVVCDGDSAVTEAQIRACCKQALDSRKQPARVVFLQHLAKTAGGKIDVANVRRQIEAIDTVVKEAPSRLRSADSLAPTLIEPVIRRALSSVLDLPARHGDDQAGLGADLPFSEMGLDSVGAVRLVRALGAELKRDLSPTLVYACPTIAKLALRLSAERQGGEAARESTAVDRQREFRAGAAAVVGIGCRLPGGANSPRELWRLLESGTDATSEGPLSGLSAAGNRERAGFLQDPDGFDANFFRLGMEAPELDPRHRMFLEVAWEALEDAGHDPLNLAQRTGVFLGIYGSRRTDRATLGTCNGMAVARLCHFLDIHGPVLTIDTTCSSSLVALDCAIDSLRLGKCDLAIVGGVNLLAASSADGSLGVVAPDGRCKAFDAAANGFGRGEGCVVVLLKRMDDAVRASDRVYATIRGSAINHDGRSTSLVAPNASAQEEVIRLALRAADAAPDEIQYLEAHGTGTVLGDAVEAEALARVFKDRSQPLMIGSVKTNLGHLEAAAGLAGLLKTILAIEKGRIPPSLHFSDPNPHIPWSAVPLSVQARVAAWPRPDRPLTAGVSSFGMSGTNAHVIVSNAPPDARKQCERTDAGADTAHEECARVLLPLSAKTSAALRARALQYAEVLDAALGPAYSDVAYTASCRRAHLEHRLAVIGGSHSELADELRRFAAGAARRAATGFASPPRTGLALVFGAHEPCLKTGPESLHAEPVFREAFSECMSHVARHVSWRLQDAVEASIDVRRADVALPLLLALHVGLASLWRSWGVEPIVVAGYDGGEAAAAYASGALSLEQAAFVACELGRITQERVSDNGARNDELSEALRGLTYSAPRIALVSAVTGELNPSLDSAYWIGATATPERFERGARSLLARGCSVVVQIGSNTALERELQVMARDEPRFSAKLVSVVAGAGEQRDVALGALGELYCAGYPIGWSGLYREGRRLVSLPSYPWEHVAYGSPRSAAAGAARGDSLRLPGAAPSLEAPSAAARANAVWFSAADDRAGAIASYLRAELSAHLDGRLEAVGDDEFLHTLGLDSLAVLRLGAKLGDELGIVLDSTSLSADLRFRELVALAQTASVGATQRSSPATRTPVVRLNAVEGDLPLVLVHPIGGGIDCYRSIAAALPHPVIAIEMREVSRLAEHSIEALAERYVSLLAGRVDSPFVLGGWSFGGIVAYQMGVDLLASGRDVPLIVLIDSYFPRPEIELNRADRVAQFFSSATMGEGVRCNASDLEHLLEPPYDGDRARFAARVGEEAARLEPIPGLSAADVQRLYAVFEANLDACSRYRPGRYAGRALSIRATRTNERAARGWGELIADFREEPLTGDHYSIMREPGVRELNETLRRELSFSQASADAVATATAHRAREEGARQELARGLTPEGRA